MKRYGPIEALRGVSLRIQEGAVGLLGPNGAGKSTLIKGLLGLLHCQEGSARVLGMDTRRQAREIRRQVGFMPEDDCFLPDMTGVEAIAFMGELSGLPRRAALGRAHEVCDFVRIGEERYRETQTYSTGMRQKVKLAQALVHDPKLVFLDEPTSGLDPRGRRRMLNLIHFLVEQRGLSVVLSTHLLPDVEAICTTVIILGAGRVLIQDRLDDIRRHSENRFVVGVQGNVAAFRNALAEKGCAVTDEKESTLSVAAAEGDLARMIFEAATASGVAVRHLTRSQNTLEDVFMKAVRGGDR